MSRCWVDQTDDSDSSYTSHADDSNGLIDLNRHASRNGHKRQDLLSCFQGVFPFSGRDESFRLDKSQSLKKGLSRSKKNEPESEVKASKNVVVEKISPSDAKEEGTDTLKKPPPGHKPPSSRFQQANEVLNGDATENDDNSAACRLQFESLEQQTGLNDKCNIPASLGDGLVLPDVVSILSATTPLHLRPAPTIKHINEVGTRDNQTFSNQWSEPDAGIFLVRGRKYLTDHHKAASHSPSLFHARGMDVFQTTSVPRKIADQCPLALLGGKLRKVPTFIVNLRFAWGILACYFAIPEKFIPYMRYFGSKQHFNQSSTIIDDEASDDDAASLKVSIQHMTPGERCLARFLMASQSTKNGTLKLIPVVVEGPWIVRKSVTGKPVIIGNKLPVEYSYGASFASMEEYLECDLDVGNSSAFARNVTSLCRGYSKELTLDFGFVIQGNQDDELPEHLLGAIRIHRLDLERCPQYPGDDDVDATPKADVASNEQLGYHGNNSYTRPVNMVNDEAYSSLDEEDEFWDCHSHNSALSSLPIRK